MVANQLTKHANRMTESPAPARTCSAASRCRLVLLPCLILWTLATSAIPSRGEEVSATLLTLPRLSPTQLNEFVDSLRLKLEIESGYASAPLENPAWVPAVPEGVAAVQTLQKTGDGSEAWIRFGYIRYVSKAPDLYVFAATRAAETITANPDIEQIRSFIEVARAANAVEADRDLFIHDLDYEIIQLSYVDTTAALNVLSGFGVTTIENAADLKFPLKMNQLPVVVKMPGLTKEQVALLGATGDKFKNGNFGVSVSLSSYEDLPHNASTGPDFQLLVYFHPGNPAQFGLVRNYLDEVIDRAARQVFIEGMVLEISEEGLSELGVDWEFQSGNFQWALGAFSASNVTDALSTVAGDFDTRNNFKTEFSARLRALVAEGKAEVLSRPSVLTLNNRQATIRVGTDIPIATSQEGITGSSNKLAFNFEYLPIGILLNVRPRISENGKEVSMLVDIIVSDKVPGEDLTLEDNQGRILASAPTVSSRRVQTYALIENNTPFIVGGLVRKDESKVEARVPGVGNIPLLGNLFKSTSSESARQEVIIVLTPYVIEDDAVAGAKPHLPKGEDRFDAFGDRLFRDAYRIRAEDVFDLGFIRENHRLQQYMDVARSVKKLDVQLSQRDPFSQFALDGTGAVYILIERMIYDVIKRLSSDDRADVERVDSRIPLDRLIYFKKQAIGGYEVESLAEMLRLLGDGDSPEGFFDEMIGKALVLSFDIGETETGEISQTPSVSLIDCFDRRDWGRELWAWNHPGPNGRPRQSIVIQSSEDLLRLRRAMLLKKIVELNGGKNALNLDRFRVGRMLRFPEIGAEQRHVIDHDVARFFFHTEHYYPAMEEKVEEMIGRMDAAMQDPELRHNLERLGVELPTSN